MAETIPRARARPAPQVRPVARPVCHTGAYLAALLCLSAIGLLLRWHAISHESLWLDEGYTLLFSGMSLPRLFMVGGAHEHPPLYYLIVHLLNSVHYSYLTPRYVSALAGALSIPVLGLLGARLFNRTTGVVAAILLTVAPFQVWYAQDGRGYELAGLFALLSYLTIFTALDRPRGALWVGYAACTALAVYTEYTTAMVLLPQALLMARARQRGLARVLWLSWAGAALAFLPWVGTLVLDAAGIAADYWIPGPTPDAVASTVLEFLGLLTPCPSPPCNGHELGIPGLAGHELALAILVTIPTAVVVLAALLRRRLTLLIVVCWLLTPFVVVLALSLQRSLYLDRVFLDATFALYLLVGYGVACTLRRGPVAVLVLGLVAVLVGGGLANLQPIYAGGANPDWKSPGRDLAAAYRPGQSVIFNPGVLRSLVASYLPVGWRASRETPLWSRSYLDVPGWQQRYPQPHAPNKPERERIETRLRDVQFSAATRGQRQVWLVTYDYPGMNDGRRWFADHGFELWLSELYPGDTRLELWSRDAPRTLGPAVVPAGSFKRDWQRHGGVRLQGGVAVLRWGALSRSFAIQPGRLYVVSTEFQGIPPASKPQISLQTYDAAGRPLDLFPRTMWYDWPVDGVWLAQSFGFIAPPGAVRAELTLRVPWGEGHFRNVGIYRER